MTQSVISRIDKNIIQGYDFLSAALETHHARFYPNKAEIELFYDTLLFLSAITTKKNRNLFGLYEFSINEFAEITGRSRASLSKRVSGWEIEQYDDENNRVVLSTRLEQILYTLYNFDLPVSQIYNYGKLKAMDWNKPGSKTVISRLQSQISNAKTGQKMYFIDINNFYIHAIIQQFLQIKFDDISKIRGSRTSRYPIFFYLLEQRNNLHKSPIKLITPNLALLQRLCGISYDGIEDLSVRRTKTKSKIISILNGIKGDNLNFEINDHPSNRNVLCITFSPQKYIGDIEQDNAVFKRKALGKIAKDRYDLYLLDPANMEQNIQFSDWLKIPVVQPILLDEYLKYYREYEEQSYKYLTNSGVRYSFYRTYFPNWNEEEFLSSFQKLYV